MTWPCPERQDQIADYVLGALDDRQAEAVREHLASCDGCRRYAQSLGAETKSLIALGWQVGADMEARQNKVIEALREVMPTPAGRTRVLSLLRGRLRMAVAAVLVLGAGVSLGRWTAPRVDVERLRADLQASLTTSIQPSVQEAVAAQLGEQLRGDLQLFAVEFTAGMKLEMEKRSAKVALDIDELRQNIDAARAMDHQRVAEALEQMKNHQDQIGRGFQTLVALTANPTAPVQQ